MGFEIDGREVVSHEARLWHLIGHLKRGSTILRLYADPLLRLVLLDVCVVALILG